MVTFKLIEVDGNIAVYHYWAENKEQGKPPLTEEEWPVPNKPLNVTFSGQMAYVKIKRVFERTGELPKEGRNIRY